MFFLDELPFFERAGRWLAAMLCQAIYPLISFLFDLFYNITKVNILSGKDIQPIYQRITLILTIVMVFYVTFEFVKFVVQPDGITDKEKGVGNIVYRMVLVVVLIAFVPKIFDYAYQLQHKIIDSEIISKVIVGNAYSSTNASMGGNFSANIFSMFYKAEENIETDWYRGIVNQNLYSLRYDGDLSQLSAGLYYNDVAVNNEGLISTEEGDDTLIPGIDFQWVWAIGVGIFIAYILLLYCVDLGVRWAQLLFLQVMAPIAIIGYLAPKKDGIFQKWIKQCLATYLDLFIRIAIMYFVALICSILAGTFSSNELFSNLGDVGDTMKTFIYIVLVLGLLLFMKKAPELLKELFPKTSAASGNFGLKAGERVPALAARALGAGLGATRAIGGAISRAHNRHMRNKANDAKSLLTKEGRDQYRQRKEHRNQARQLGNNLKAAERMNERVSQDKVDEAKRRVQNASQAVKNAKTPEERARAEKNLKQEAEAYRQLMRTRTAYKEEVGKDGKIIRTSSDKTIREARENIAKTAAMKAETEEEKQAKADRLKAAGQQYRDVTKGDVAETASKYADAREQVAEDENTKYRSAAAAGLWGAVAGGFTGAASGAKATKLEEIIPKAKEGHKKDIANVHAVDKYYDEGGTGFIDRVTTQAKKAIGMDTDYVETNLQAQSLGSKIKRDETSISRAANVKTSFDAMEDRIKGKLGDVSKGVAAKGKVELKKVTDEKGNVIEIAEGTNLKGVARDYHAKAEVAKNNASAASQVAQDKYSKLSEQAKKLANGDPSVTMASLTPQEQIAYTEYQQAKKDADRAGSLSAEAETRAADVDKYITREIMSQYLRKEVNGSEVDDVVVKEIAKLEDYVRIARQDPEIMAIVQSTLSTTKPHLIPQFMSGKFDDYDALDDVKNAVQEAHHIITLRKQSHQDQKTRLESSKETEAQKAANDYTGGGGGK